MILLRMSRSVAHPLMIARFWNSRVNDVYVAIHLCERVVHFHGYPFSSRPCQISRTNGPNVHAAVRARAHVCHYKTYFNNIHIRTRRRGK